MRLKQGTGRRSTRQPTLLASCLRHNGREGAHQPKHPLGSPGPTARSTKFGPATAPGSIAAQKCTACHGEGGVSTSIGSQVERSVASSSQPTSTIRQLIPLLARRVWQTISVRRFDRKEAMKVCLAHAACSRRHCNVWRGSLHRDLNNDFLALDAKTGEVLYRSTPPAASAERDQLCARRRPWMRLMRNLRPAVNVGVHGGFSLLGGEACHELVRDITAAG
jgi:hypothetical protein